MRWTDCLVSAALTLCLVGCGRGPEKVELKVFHAGSLSASFRALEAEFEARYPSVDVRREAYGSAAAIRQVTELGRPADVVASADCRLLQRLMIDAEPKWADDYTVFARSSMVIAYADGADPISPDNWRQALREGAGRVGMSNPNLDPCGYRALFCVYLAGGDGLFEKLILDHSNLSVTVEDGVAAIQVPEGVRYRGRLFMRPKETGLLPLLELGAIDYLFIYRSVARQHGLHFLELPDEVNLGRQSLAGRYGRVWVRQFCDKPGRSALIEAGPILYGVTVPRGAPHPRLGGEFIRLLLSEAGRDILEEFGPSPLSLAEKKSSGEDD
ncbi:MAG: tungstate ABC transporter substrate-binding protein WtpA [Planctomycetes bacterium]|nr:tungstate ABC transporter substrate-binding protein WtpA [Planctomycetota bacterium]